MKPNKYTSRYAYDRRHYEFQRHDPTPWLPFDSDNEVGIKLWVVGVAFGVVTLVVTFGLVFAGVIA